MLNKVNNNFSLILKYGNYLAYFFLQNIDGLFFLQSLIDD